LDWRIISIGTLASNPLWNETTTPRTGHTTTTTVKGDDGVLLIDPSLPPQIINARLQERWGIDLSKITHVFLTSFDPDRRRTLGGLSHADWFMSEPEIQSAAIAISEEIQKSEGDDELTTILEQHRDLLAEFHVAPDSLFSGVDLFPVPGYTPGSCGLLLPTPKQTILICGDTIATHEHLERGQVLQNCANIEMAQESFKECVEIADVLVPGRDNVVLNPTRL
jgi:glyoxylase-like metal-dependent hydrolase (beta-lactamase superfamily II)